MKNWAQMTKEQKQLWLMGGVLGAIVIFLIFQFGLSPFLASKARMTEEYETLKAQLDQATQAIKSEAQLGETLDDKTRMLEQAYRDYIPAIENPLSWATKKIYGDGRSIGVDIESVSEVVSDVAQWAGKDQARRAFKPYAVRIATECSYAELIRLLRELEKNNPRMFVTDIDVQAREVDRLRHSVSLVVEWPCWKSTERISAFTAGGEPVSSATPPAGG
ncbi:MAG: GspMb/PilO family protein [bacterium]